MEEFEGLSLSSLGTDEAYVRVRWESQASPAWLYHLDTDCHRCPWQLLGSVSLSPFTVKTHHTNRFLLRQDNRTRYPVSLRRTMVTAHCVVQIHHHSRGR